MKFMITDMQEAFLFLMDIIKGKLPSHDLYLVGLIMIMVAISESIRDIREKPRLRWSNSFLKWISVSFLVVSIYLSGFYFVTNLFVKIFPAPDAFHHTQNLRSLAIISLTMTSISVLIIALGKLDRFFISKRAPFTLLINSISFAIGMHVINLVWYEPIKVPIWSYGLIGVINTLFICFLLWEQNRGIGQEQGRVMQ